MSVESLERYAAKFSGIVQDIDLEPWRTEEVAHKVKPANDYAVAVAELIFLPPEQEGCKTPFAGIDEHFRFRKHELTIWSGYKGHGKSAALSQAIVSFMTRQESAFIVSPEFRPEKVLERMIYQFYGTRQLNEEQVFSWFEWAKGKLWLYDVQHSLNPEDVLALCRYAVETYKVNHVLVDSLMKCGIAPDDYGSQKKLVDRLQTLCHKFPFHFHLVAHARKGHSDEAPPKLHDIKGASEIADLAENVLVVWRNKPKEKAKSLGDASKSQEPDAVILVEAQRNADGWVGGSGLSYDPASMIFHEAGRLHEAKVITSGENSCPI